MSSNPSTSEDLASSACATQEGTGSPPWPRGSKTICIPCDQERYPELVANPACFRRTVDPDYTPESVNTDGWEATQKAWQALFPRITVILCFLHAFIKIRERCKKGAELFRAIGNQVWRAYRAPTKRAFVRVSRHASQNSQSKLFPSRRIFL